MVALVPNVTGDECDTHDLSCAMAPFLNCPPDPRTPHLGTVMSWEEDDEPRVFATDRDYKNSAI